MFDNCQDVICTVSASGVVSSINHACLSMWGYESEEIIGKSIFEITADAQSAARTFEFVADGGGAREQESTVIRKNGTDCDVLWSLSWSQQQRAIVAIAHDISQRKELERLKQEFLAMVSHDMRTPLSSISVTTEMLCAGAMGPLPDKAQQQLQVVVRNCDRLLGLINDLLDIEKLEAGQMQMSIQAVEAGQIWQRTAEALQSSAQQKNVNILVEAPAGLMVEADPDRLVQVGVNLLSNAIKFSEPQSTVKMIVKAMPGFVEFSVCDSGRGIPESHLDAIFERFRQVSAADGKRSAGTGLGLPICKQIVERHGGEIGVSSAPGWGSTFYFRIPAAGRVGAPHA
ncbi:MAG: PAS domain-containing sensor histidine kinase, partial [Candidatus Saccharimonadales bacterium]